MCETSSSDGPIFAPLEKDLPETCIECGARCSDLERRLCTVLQEGA